MANEHTISLPRGEPVRKRSVRVAGQPTSVSLEPSFWAALGEIAMERGLSLNALLSEIDATRFSIKEAQASVPSEGANLSSAARVYALWWFRSKA